jgi:hypothetical protein
MWDRCGDARCRRRPVRPRPVHPRGRGERVRTWNWSVRKIGSSPRAQGTHAADLHGRQPLRFIPAGAGGFGRHNRESSGAAAGFSNAPNCGNARYLREFAPGPDTPIGPCLICGGPGVLQVGSQFALEMPHVRAPGRPAGDTQMVGLGTLTRARSGANSEDLERWLSPPTSSTLTPAMRWTRSSRASRRFCTCGDRHCDDQQHLVMTAGSRQEQDAPPRVAPVLGRATRAPNG